MIKIPTLPFASSLVSGEYHEGLGTINDVVFNREWMERMHEAYRGITPTLLSEKLAIELLFYVGEASKELSALMFERLIEMEPKGVVTCPALGYSRKSAGLVTVAYRFNKEKDALEMTLCLKKGNDRRTQDAPFLEFTAERIPDSFELGLDISDDVKVPVMMVMGWPIEQIVYTAWKWVKFVCIYETMYIYNCIKFRSFLYEPLIKKIGVRLNQNDVAVSYVALACEDYTR